MHIMKRRNTGNIQEDFGGIRAPVDADDAHHLNVLRYKDKASVGVKCSKKEVLKRYLLSS